MLYRYLYQSVQHYTSNLLSSCHRDDVLASRLQTTCLPNTPTADVIMQFVVL